MQQINRINRINRRQFLAVSAVGAGVVASGLAGCAPVAQPIMPPPVVNSPISTGNLAADMAQAATQFLAALPAAQRAKASYAFGDSERLRWHWTTPSGFPRNGLPLSEMNEQQQALAYALLQRSVSSQGYEKALNIMALQRELGNNPALYFITVFGTPGADTPWGWRWEGHHLSRQFTVVGNEVAVTPFFLGTWPTISEAGLRAMPREEDLALELIATLPDNLRQQAIFQNETLTRHITQNQERVSPLEPVGIAYGDLAADAQKLVVDLLQTYLSVLPESLAAATYTRITDAGLNEIRFGWAGPLELRRPTYYRLQGPTFLLEHDKSRNGGTHIHSVWRDFERDFGYHLL